MLGYLMIGSSKMLPFTIVKPEWGCTEMNKSGPNRIYHEKTGLLETEVGRTMERRLYWLNPKEFPPTVSVDCMKVLKPLRGRGVNGTFA